MVDRVTWHRYSDYWFAVLSFILSIYRQLTKADSSWFCTIYSPNYNWTYKSACRNLVYLSTNVTQTTVLSVCFSTISVICCRQYHPECRSNGFTDYFWVLPLIIEKLSKFFWFSLPYLFDFTPNFCYRIITMLMMISKLISNYQVVGVLGKNVSSLFILLFI